MSEPFETWHLVSKYTRWCKWVRPIIQRVCGWTIGHKMSPTEWGYGGGPLADTWCRWCNKKMEIPVDELPQADEWRGLIDE